MYCIQQLSSTKRNKRLRVLRILQKNWSTEKTVISLSFEFGQKCLILFFFNQIWPKNSCAFFCKCFMIFSFPCIFHIFYNVLPYVFSTWIISLYIVYYLDGFIIFHHRNKNVRFVDITSRWNETPGNQIKNKKNKKKLFFHSCRFIHFRRLLKCLKLKLTTVFFPLLQFLRRILKALSPLHIYATHLNIIASSQSILLCKVILPYKWSLYYKGMDLLFRCYHELKITIFLKRQRNLWLTVNKDPICLWLFFGL